MTHYLIFRHNSIYFLIKVIGLVGWLIVKEQLNFLKRKINKFFKDMSNGKLGDKDLSFSVNVQDIRRRLMMSAIIGQGEEKVGGMRILKNVHI